MMTSSAQPALDKRWRFAESQLFTFPFLSVAYYFVLIFNFPRFSSSLTDVAYRVDPNLLKYFGGGVLVFSLALILISTMMNHRSLTGAFSYLIFVLVFVPICAVYHISDGSTVFVLACFASLALAFVLFRDRGAPVTGLNPAWDRRIAAAFALYAGLVLLYLASRGALQFSFLDLATVYDVRAEAGAGGRIATSRWFSISAYVATSVVLAYGLLYRNWFACLFGLANAYLLYNAFGHKLYLFAAVLTVAGFLFMRLRGGSGFVFLVALALMATYVMSGIDAFGLSKIAWFVDQTFARRFIYLQPYLAFAWYDVFLEKPMILMSNSILFRNFIEYPFDLPYTTVVSLEMYGKVFVPNTGIFGTGFAHFGLPGIALFTTVAYLLLSYIDHTARRMGSRFLVMAALMPSMLFFEAEVMTVLTSFGLILLIAACMVANFLRDNPNFLRAPYWPRGNPALRYQ